MNKKNLIRLLVSILIAFSLWVYVVTVISPESEDTFFNIPVVLNNESVLSDKGLMLTTEAEPTVNLRLRGNRTDLSNLKTSDITVVADLSKINEAGQQTLSYSVTVNGYSFEVVNQTPNQITLDVAEWASKEVPVVVDYTGTLGLDYIAYKHEAVLNYENVTLTGPKEVVDQVTQAVIEVNLDDKTETISESYRYTLCDENGEPVDAASLKTNVAEVTLTLRIQRVKEVALLLDVTYGGGATKDTTTITMSEEIIKVTGSEKQLEDLNSITVGSIDLSQIEEDQTMTFPITLQVGMENLTGVSEVTVDIAFHDLATKVINVTKFLVSGKPGNLDYEIGAKTMPVTLRGPQELLDTITEENVSLLINLSEGEIGGDLYDAQVMIDTKFEKGGIGAVGSYSVFVTLTEKDTGGTE